MNIIQSFWAQRDIPAHYSGAVNPNLWPSLKYELLSRAYSCLQATKYYPSVQLYTDSYGKSILIDALELPYTAVYTSLDDIVPAHPELWIEGFLHTLSQQTEPFVYVHGDLFFKSILPNDVICHDAFLLTTGRWLDDVSREQIEQSFGFTDSYVYRSFGVHYRSLQSEFSLGLVGFGRLDWLPDYIAWSRTVLQKWLSDKTFAHANSYNMPFVNAMLKRVLSDHNIPLHECDYLFMHEERYQDLFSYRPENVVTHIPYHLKNDRTVCLELELLVKTHYPDYYERILSYVEKHNTSNSVATNGEQELPSLFRFSPHKSHLAVLFGHFPRTLVLLQLQLPDEFSRFLHIHKTDTTPNLIQSFELFADSQAENNVCLKDALQFETSKRDFTQSITCYLFPATTSYLCAEWSDEQLLAQIFSLSPQAMIYTVQYDWTICTANQDNKEMNIGMLLEMPNKSRTDTYILLYRELISGSIAERCLRGHDSLLLGFDTPVSLSSVFEEMKELSNISSSTEYNNFQIRFMDAARFFIRHNILARV